MDPVRGLDNQPYCEFFLKWSEAQQGLCADLLDALNGGASESELKKVVKRVEDHYAMYYDAKDEAAKDDVLRVLNPSWTTPLENAFMWIGGWRPSMLFQLVYALAGQQVEAELTDFLNGIETPSLAALTAQQLSAISKLQIRTHKTEDALGRRQAIIQQSLVDQPLLALASADLQQLDGEGNDGTRSAAVEEKVKAQEDLLRSADALRLESLKELLSIFTTTQAAQYLVTAGRLHSTVRRLGLERQQRSLERKQQQG